MIYLDHAATTKLSQTALDAMLPYLTQDYGNPSSLHRAGQTAKAAVEQARRAIATVFNAAPAEIYFTASGSESANQALLTAAAWGRQHGKYHIITSKFEHHAVAHTLDALTKQGFRVTYLDVYENGIVRPADLQNALTPDTCLVTIMAANNEIGTKQPLAALGAICRAQGVLFHTDAVAAVGQITLDVKALKVDLLSFAAHKFYGPQGVGGLYARQGLELVNLVYGGAQERGKRAGTENVAGVVGMAVALQEAVAQIPTVVARETALRDKLCAGLLQIPDSVLNGDATTRLANNVNVAFAGVNSEDLLPLLDAAGICVSAGSACSAGALTPSATLQALGRTPELARGAIRLTLGRDTTAAEIDTVIAKVRETVAYLRGRRTN